MLTTWSTNGFACTAFYTLYTTPHHACLPLLTYLAKTNKKKNKKRPKSNLDGTNLWPTLSDTNSLPISSKSGYIVMVLLPLQKRIEHWHIATYMRSRPIKYWFGRKFAWVNRDCIYRYIVYSPSRYNWSDIYIIHAWRSISYPLHSQIILSMATPNSIKNSNLSELHVCAQKLGRSGNGEYSVWTHGLWIVLFVSVGNRRKTIHPS